MLIPSLSKWNVVTFSINKAKCLWLNAWNHSFLIVVVDIRGKWRCYKLPDALKQNKPSKRRKNAFLPKKKKSEKYAIAKVLTTLLAVGHTGIK